MFVELRVFSQYYFSWPGAPCLVQRRAAWLSVKKEKPSFTPSKVLLMFEYLFLIRKVHFEEATGVGVLCVCVCARALHASEQTSEGAGRKMVLSRLRTRRPVYSSGFFFLFALAPMWPPELCLCSRISSRQIVLKAFATFLFCASFPSQWAGVITLSEIYEEKYLCW